MLGFFATFQKHAVVHLLRCPVRGQRASRSGNDHDRYGQVERDPRKPEMRREKAEQDHRAQDATDPADLRAQAEPLDAGCDRGRLTPRPQACDQHGRDHAATLGKTGPDVETVAHRILRRR